MPAPDRDALRLLDLLAVERELLVRGRLDQLAKLETAKTAATRRIASRKTRPDPATLRQLRAAAASNQRLYEAALIGVQRIRDQVAALIAGGGAELRTYGSDGGRQALVPGNGKLERRA